MGNRYAALLRAERERRAHAWPIGDIRRDLIERARMSFPWRGRSWRHSQGAPAASEERDSELMERMGQLERKLDALDETLAKQRREFEGSLMRVTEMRLAAMQALVDEELQRIPFDALRRLTRVGRFLWILVASWIALTAGAVVIATLAARQLLG